MGIFDIIKAPFNLVGDVVHAGTGGFRDLTGGFGKGAESLGQGVGQGLGGLGKMLSSPLLIIGVGVVAVVVLPRLMDRK